MKSVSRFATLVLFVVLDIGARAVAAAQPAAPALNGAANPACVDTGAVPPKTTCPLFLQKHELRRVADGHLVAYPGYFRPMPLSSIVRGDSARRYALLYEHDARVASWLTQIGQGLAIGGVIVAKSYKCGVHDLRGCSNPVAPYAIGASVLSGGAIALLFVEIHRRHRAWVSAGKAVWWHNLEVDGQ